MFKITPMQFPDQSFSCIKEKDKHFTKILNSELILKRSLDLDRMIPFWEIFFARDSFLRNKTTW